MRLNKYFFSFILNGGQAMRCVIQKVTHADVVVEGETVGEIGNGYMVLLGAENGDTEADARYCAEKIAGLRVFEDENDKMNLSLADVGGSVLLVSQFTLLADARHGRRPDFIQAARPEVAEPLCDTVKAIIEGKGIHVETGRFRTHMQVSLLNDGPVTILLDSRRNF
jgi:D-tyrosyl-tRNA(Tyr) deacylase